VVVLGSWRTPAVRAESLALLAQRLTDRDRAIVNDLGRLRVLTLEQLARVYFSSRSSARDRLDTLRELGVVDRFRPSTRAAYRYVLAWTGMRLHHAATEERRLALSENEREGTDKPRAAPSRPAAEALIARLIANPMRAHLEAVNDCYTRLAAAARVAEGVELVYWHSEAEATKLLGDPRLHPDGAFDLRFGEAERRCWFEHDTGSEPTQVLERKGKHYRGQLRSEATKRGHFGAVADPQCVLFELTRPGREQNLHRALAEEADTAPIATCTTERSTDPLGPVWWLVGDPPGKFRTIADLPTRIEHFR
jgi:DNA-binding Lrp family transcriptional regulator